MNCRYKVGDKVRVRSGLNPDDEFRMRSGPRNGQVTYDFVDQMADMAGKFSLSDMLIVRDGDITWKKTTGAGMMKCWNKQKKTNVSVKVCYKERMTCNG